MHETGALLESVGEQLTRRKRGTVEGEIAHVHGKLAQVVAREGGGPGREVHDGRYPAIAQPSRERDELLLHGSPLVGVQVEDQP